LTDIVKERTLTQRNRETANVLSAFFGQSPEEETTVATDTEVKPKAKAGGLRELAESRGEILYFKPSIVKIEEGFNAREYDTKDNKEHLKRIKDSIAEVGVTNPGIVRLVKGEVFVVSGHTRLLAAQELELAGDKDLRFPAIVEAKGTDDASRLANLHINNMGKNFEVLELANLAVRMMNAGNLNQTQVAKKLSISQAYVGGLIKLAEAPEKLKQLIRSGKVKATLVLELLREHDGDGEAVYQIVSDSAAAAAVNGNGKVTKAKVKGGKSKTKEEAPMYYKREAVNEFILQLCIIAEDKEIGSASEEPRKSVRKLLKAHDVDAKDWLTAETEVEEE
jgi:ParB family chromosome partitioning protein